MTKWDKIPPHCSFTMAHCCVCLENDVTLQDIVSKVGDSPSWIDKLRDVSPEMNWLEDSAICNSCTMSVEQAFTFRSFLHHVQNSSITKEIQTEIIKEEYNCIHCQKSFSDIDELDYHEKINHAIIKEELALVIDEEEESRNNKKSMFEKLTEDKRPFSCSECPESFYTRASMYKHTITRHRTPTYKCHLCKRAFLLPGALQDHIQDHQNLRKFKCYHCDSAFNTNTALQRHLKRQGVLPTQYKQYNCDICEDTFRTGIEVIAHCVKTHSMDVRDIKPHKCNFCSFAFRTPAKLCYHKKYAHKK